ncbi:hypothetical protein JZ788_17855, partial [Enterobacteriaceae bacterium YMB-R21]|nr:hypothetical protein [Tenebrionicola larvae]
MIGLLLILIALTLLWWRGGDLLSLSVFQEGETPSLLWWLVIVFGLLIMAFATALVLLRRAPRQLDREGITAPPLSKAQRIQPRQRLNTNELKQHLRQQDGWRWKRRRPWLLVTGSPSLVEQMAPGLTTQGWLCCNDAVLLWGGNITEAGSGQDLPAIRRLRGRRPVDALVHMADDTAADSEALLRALRQMALVLR